MNDLVAFLRARLGEDEAAARPLIGMPGALTAFGPVAQFIASTNPARVLRDVEAKRAIVDAYQAVTEECATMLRDRRPRKYGEWDGLDLAARRLAAVYRDHPDYRQEWVQDGD